MALQLTYNSLQEKVDQRLGSQVNLPDLVATTPSNPTPINIKISGLSADDISQQQSGKVTEVDTLLGLDIKNKRNTYQGKQLLLNSGRIILNSYEDYAMLFAKEGVAISTEGNCNIDVDGDITLFGEGGLYLGVPNKGALYESRTKQKAITAPDDNNLLGGSVENPPAVQGTGNSPLDPIVVNAGSESPEETSSSAREREQIEERNLNNSRNVSTEDRDYEALPLGNKLVDWLSDLITAIEGIEITTPAGAGYLAGGDPAYNFKKLLARLPELTSTFAYIDGRSHGPAEDPGPPPPPVQSLGASSPLGTSDASQTVAPQSGPVGEIPQYTLSQLQARAAELGYDPINESFSLVGIRSNADAYDSYDDMLIVVANGQLSYFAGTTNPGGKILSGGFKKYNQAGAAVLVPGQYESHKFGSHKGYAAGSQAIGRVTISRDGNENQKAGDVPSSTQQTGFFGINVHRSSANKRSRRVNGYSAGCQVFQAPGDFNYFMSEWDKAGKKTLQYTLFQQFAV